jgi:carbonic anhydrase
MNRLSPVTSKSDIKEDIRNNPIGKLLEYHNLNLPFDECSKADLLVSMCMDNRHQLRIPNNFAYILRSGGGNLRHSEFKVSYAVAVGGIRNIALIGHSGCGMVNLFAKKEMFINGLIDNAGWEREYAEEHFNNFSPIYEIGHEIDFLLTEAKRLRTRYPKIKVIPLYYKIEDNKLYQLIEDVEI